MTGGSAERSMAKRPREAMTAGAARRCHPLGIAMTAATAQYTGSGGRRQPQYEHDGPAAVGLPSAATKSSSVSTTTFGEEPRDGSTVRRSAAGAADTLAT
jgi:hypothetical protein